MTMIKHRLPAACAFTVLQLALMQAFAAPLKLSDTPLFLTTANKPNILMLYGNSNSMDSDATGRAVGSTAATSKSEISRKAISTLIDNYARNINMGLMAYQQYPAVKSNLYDAQYDVSYDPANYDPAYNGPRNGVKKKFRIEVPVGSGHWVYYNVNLPGYDESTTILLKEFCYAATACTSPVFDFKGIAGNCSVREKLPVRGGGPWDENLCYPNHTGNSALADRAPAQNAGYSGAVASRYYVPTDADLGQGITDFGKRMASQYVSSSWFNNAAPGPGYLHVPVGLLDPVQIPKLKVKLGKTQYDLNAPTNKDYPLQNSGLSPLAGSVLTANNYYNGKLTDINQGGSASPPVVPNSCGKNFLVTLTDGLPSVTANGTASADTAAMLTELTGQVRDLKASAAKVETYVVGFALPYGVSITQLDSIAAAGGSGTAHYADDPTTLDATFKRIFVDILSKTSAASAVALNAQSLTVGGNAFQARFSSSDWSGQLAKLNLRVTDVKGKKVTRVDPTPAWLASDAVDAQSRDNKRTIITRKSTGLGIPFRWTTAPSATTLDAAQIAMLNTNAAGVVDGHGAKRLAYLRGLATDEGTAGLKFRARPTTKLGDIVNSAPVFVGVPDQNYALPGYIEHRAAMATRPAMVYVGANDGMLHGFDFISGGERLAYIPNAVFRNLSNLTSPQYEHRNYVDGSPSTSDVEVGSTWRTMLVSGMGTGARGIFGLDITNPGSFSEASAASIAKFEFTELQDPDVGHVSGPIGIAKLNNGKWGAIFGNGFNSSGNANNGNAYLFIVDAVSGQLIKKIHAVAAPPTGGVAAAETRPNGLSGPLLIDENNDDTVDHVYAGDLLGNMWKFNLTATGVGAWAVSHKVFQAPAPITSTPDAGEHPDGGTIVYFGTGKYLEIGDIGAPPTSAPFNAMYGIRDLGRLVDESTLVVQNFEEIGPMAGGQFRKATKRAVVAANNGWKLPFPTNGERVISAPQLRDGRVIFTSMTPSEAPCSTGGSSYLNQVNWINGGELDTAQFDTNGDQEAGGSGDETVASVKRDGILSPPVIQDGDNNETNFLNGSGGVLEEILTKGAQRSRRLSWRQLKK